jgi:hypothetical protein
MKTKAISIVGLLLGLVGAAAMIVALRKMMSIGTCASGGPYVSAHPCPSGSGLYELLIPGGLLVWMLGTTLAGGFRKGLGLVSWGAFWLGSGGALLVQALGSSSESSGGKLGSYIIAAVFIPMGAVPLVARLLGGGLDRRSARARARMKEAEARITSVRELERDEHSVTLIINYQVEPHNAASFEVVRTKNSPLFGVPPKAGDRVRVRYDPEHPDKLTELGRVRQATTGAGTVARVVNRGADPVQRLADLAKLRDTGAVSASEFDRLKAEILTN